jgi:hypothetical protein
MNAGEREEGRRRSREGKQKWEICVVSGWLWVPQDFLGRVT